MVRADRIVLPGQGAFADCAAGLRAIGGVWKAIEQATGEGRPFLGICVGMQLMAERGLEFTTTRGLGWIGGDVVAIRPDLAHTAGQPLKVPHMGWNDLQHRRPEHPLLTGIPAGSHGYFVHSYRFACADAQDVIASVEYGGAIPAVIGRANLAGTQFHPEKSQTTGLQLIGNFLGWDP